MTNLENIQRVVSWHSKKNEDGTYTSTVYSFDYELPATIHAEYTRKTRASATNAAKKAVRHIKSIAA